MKIAVDKNSLNVVDNKNEYIYLFDNESLEELLKIGLHCIRYDRCEFVDINTTDYEIDCIKKVKTTEKDWNKIEYKDYKIGIIIPNYNYEHTIEKCLSSVLNQTYKNYEIIFVDDVSTDNSVKVAEETYKKYLYDNYGYYADTNLIEKMEIVQLKQKRFNGGARNEAYLHLSNDVDYIFCIDSDDWLLDNQVLEKINRKLQSKPDVLFCGLSQWKNNELKTCFIPQYKDKYEAIRGWSGVGKIIKKSLATRQECLYNEGTLKEDKNQHCKICFYMNSFKLLQEPIYVWNQMNNKSVTTIREKVFWGTSTIRHYADTMQFALSVKGKDPKIDRFMEERIRLTKQEVDQNGDKQW